METKLSEQQSLKIIQEMIATSKNNLKDNSFFFLLWGWLVLVASLTHFVLLKTGYQHAYLPWPILMITGGVISAIAGIRIGRRARVISHVDNMVMYLWWGFTIMLLVLLIMAGFGKIAWFTLYPVIIALYGLGTFVSGGVLRFKPLIIGGVFCWIIAVVAFFVPSEFILLLTGLSVIIAYLIPGYLLKAKKD